MNWRIIPLFLLLIAGVFSPKTQALDLEVKPSELDEAELERRRVPRAHFGYVEREHTTRETMGHIAALYGLTWVIYPLSQPKEFRNEGSFKKWRNNFGKLTFDKDEPFWNWIMHPLSGSQLYLFYRANGYNRIDSFKLTFVSSTLFELTVEIYTERASVQDLFQTPVIGSILGLGLENFSMYLLNTGHTFGRFWGHALNPATLFWFYDGKQVITPTTNFRDSGGLIFSMEF
jgi:hypothetical protein